jgi:hypothetical protein
MVLEFRKRARNLSIRKRHLRISSKDFVTAMKCKKLAVTMQVIALILREKDFEVANRFNLAARIYLAIFLKLTLIDHEDTRVPRPIRLDRRIASFSVTQCYNWFKTSKEDLPRLLIGLRIPLICTFSNGSVMVGEEVMLRGLYELVTGESQFSISESVFGRHQSDQSRAFSFFINHIYITFLHLVTDNLTWWYESGHLQLSCNAIRRKMFERSQIQFEEFFVAGFVDCNCLQTCRVGSGPSEEGPEALRWDEEIQRSFYNGWKSIHGLKHQTFDLAYGMTADLHGPASLRRNDLHLLARSELNQRLHDLSRLGAYGDSIYPHLTNILSSWRYENNTVRMIEENNAFKSVRISIEWNYMVTAGLFKYLAHFEKLKVLGSDNVSKVYTVATILRNCNVTMYGSMTSNYFELEIPNNMFENYINA